MRNIRLRESPIAEITIPVLLEFTADLIVLVNFCDDDWYKLNLTVPGNLCFSTIRYLKRNGQWADCKFTRQGDKVTVNARLGGTKTLVLQFLE